MKKGIYPYEYIEDWKKSVKHYYLEKKRFLQQSKHGR